MKMMNKLNLVLVIFIISPLSSFAENISCPEITVAKEDILITDKRYWCERVDSEGMVEKHGPYLELYSNGQEKVRGQYLNNKKTGVWTSWTPTNKKIKEGSYQNDNQVGKWVYYNKYGEKEKEVNYNKSGIVKETAKSFKYILNPKPLNEEIEQSYEDSNN